MEKREEGSPENSNDRGEETRKGQIYFCYRNILGGRNRQTGKESINGFLSEFLWHGWELSGSTADMSRCGDLLAQGAGEGVVEGTVSWKALSDQRVVSDTAAEAAAFYLEF